MKPVIYDDLISYEFAPTANSGIKTITSSLSSFKGGGEIYHLYQTSKAGVLRRAYYTFSASSDNLELLTFETENMFHGRIVFESTVKAGGEWSNGRQGAEPAIKVTASAFPSGNLLFEYSHDAKNWNTDAVFANASTFNGINNQQRLIYTFFHDKPYYFRLNLDPNTRVDGDFWGIKDIVVYNIPEHRNNANRLLFLSDNINRPSGSKDNGFIQHQIPRTDLQYSWATGSLSLTSSITGTWNADTQVKLPSILGASGTNRTGQEEYFNTISANSQSFYFNRWAFNKLNAGLFNVNLDTNSIELSSSFSASFLTGSSNYFSTWNQIRVGENIIARRLRENNIISVALPPQQNRFLSNTDQNILNVSKRNDVVNYKEPVVSDKNKPLKFRFIFKGNNNPHLAHEVKISYNNIINTFANKNLKKRLGIVEKQPEAFKVIKNWLYNPNLPENENPIAKFLGYSIEEKIYPKDANTSLKETKARTKYILNIPGFDRDGFDRQLGTQRVFWRDDVNNRIRSYSGSITSMGDFNDLLNITGTTFIGDIGRSPTAEINPTAGGIIWQFTSSWSGTFSSSYGGRSILPLDTCATLNLLLTSTFTARNDYAFNNKDSTTGQVQNLTQSMRMYSFLDAGTLNSSVFMDYLTTGSGISIFSTIGENSLKDVSLPLQLIRNTNFSLYNMMAMFGTGSGLEGEGGFANYRTHPLYYTLNSGSSKIFPLPGPRYCAFLGGFESGSRPWNSQFPNGVFNQPPSSSLPISSTLDFGLRYAIDEMTSGSKRPWYDSYEAYIENIRGLIKNYSIIPEFRISDQMNFYISASGGNFRTKNTSFLSIDGVGYPSRSADIENTAYNGSFFKQYTNSDTIPNIETVYLDNKKLIKLNKIKFKFSGIKKLLPYNGFYPIQRTIQLASIYKTSFANAINGGFLNIARDTLTTNPAPGNELFDYTIKTNLSGNIDKNIAIQTSLEPFFAPGILYNTIKSGISVDWPSITGSNTFLRIKKFFPERVKMMNSVSGNIRSSINSRVPFENILTPGIVFPTKEPLTGSITSLALIETTQLLEEISPIIKDTYFNSHFDFFDPEQIISTTKTSIPFVYKNSHKNISPLFSLAINNFFAETVKFFLKDETMITFKSKEENKWEVFEVGNSYFFDLALKKTDDLVMIQAFSSSNFDFYSGYPSRILSGSKNSMDGRYFGYPCAKTRLTRRFGFVFIFV